MSKKKVTIAELQQKKDQGKKITMMTAYDYPTASLVDQSSIDTILVGDSLGMVMLGYDSTVPVTMDEMIHHCKAVSRGVKSSFIIGDMPFMSYQVSAAQAVKNAGRFLKEAVCDSVKLEGGSEMALTIKAITTAGIPVCAHIGLTPQTATMLSGFKVQGKDAEGAKAVHLSPIMRRQLQKHLPPPSADSLVFSARFFPTLSMFFDLPPSPGKSIPPCGTLRALHLERAKRTGGEEGRFMRRISLSVAYIP